MQLFGRPYKVHSFHPKFPLGFVCALGAGMLEKLDLLQEDQNGNADTVSRYIAVEGGSERFAENYFLLAVPSSYLGTRGYPGKRRQDHLVAGLVAFGYHHHISIYHDIIKNELLGHFAKSLRNAFMFLVLQIPAFHVVTREYSVVRLKVSSETHSI